MELHLISLSHTHTHWFGVEHANDYIIDAVHINKNILQELERKQNEKETFLHRYLKELVWILFWNLSIVVI